MTAPARPAAAWPDRMCKGRDPPESRPSPRPTTLQGRSLSMLPQPDDTLLAELHSGAWLDDQQFAPLRYHVPGIVPEGLSVLAGAPKVGKSWLVLGLLLAAAAGGTALGAVPVGDGGDVLYVALEDGNRRMQARCRRLLASEYRPGDPIPARFAYLTAITPGQLAGTLAEWLTGHPAGFAVVDTLGRVLPPARQGETPYSRDYRVMSELKAVADAFPGAALLMNHHDRKALSADFVDSVSGTNGIAGAADTVLVLTRAREDPAGLLQVTGRDVREGAYALTFDRGAWQLDGGGLDAAAAAAGQQRAAAGLSDRSAAVLKLVAGRPRGTTAKDAAGVLGISADMAGQYLRRLADDGRVAKAGRGLSTPLKTVSEVSEANGHSDTSDTPLGSATT